MGIVAGWRPRVARVGWISRTRRHERRLRFARDGRQAGCPHTHCRSARRRRPPCLVLGSVAETPSRRSGASSRRRAFNRGDAPG